MASRPAAQLASAILENQTLRRFFGVRAPRAVDDTPPTDATLRELWRRRPPAAASRLLGACALTVGAVYGPQLAPAPLPGLFEAPSLPPGVAQIVAILAGVLILLTVFERWARRPRRDGSLAHRLDASLTELVLLIPLTAFLGAAARFVAPSLWNSVVVIADGLHAVLDAVQPTAA